ncbi:hypothetical protein BGX23_004218, partial [Mortierella sp. AD031]
RQRYLLTPRRSALSGFATGTPSTPTPARTPPRPKTIPRPKTTPRPNQTGANTSMIN